MIDLRAVAIAILTSCLALSCAGDRERETSARAEDTAAEEGTAEGAHYESLETGTDPRAADSQGAGRSGEPAGTVVKAPRAVPETLKIDPATGEILAGGGASDSIPIYGRWHKARDDVSRRKLTAQQEEQIRKLESIGYLSGSRPAPAAGGVVSYDTSRAYEGFNFYVSGHAPEALLMDMWGEILHTWSYDFDSIWPDRDFPKEAQGRYHWRRAHLFENGDILAIHEGIGLIKLDKDSNLLWKYAGGCHHDLEVMDDGTIYVLARKGQVIPRINEEEPVLEDFIVLLDPEGVELRRVSILEAMEKSDFSKLLSHMPDKGDIFHTNTIEVLDGRLADKDPAFSAGNVLISILKINTVAVVDLNAEEAVWAFRGRWHRQHQPTVLDNGTILLFDNGGTHAINSRVIEFDPATRKIPWSYTGTHTDRFYSKTCGSCQRLPNGNTLLTESDNGRAIEVTQDKTVVWEFVSPHTAGEDDELIATLFEVIRLHPDFPLDWLHEPK